MYVSLSWTPLLGWPPPSLDMWRYHVIMWRDDRGRALGLHADEAYLFFWDQDKVSRFAHLKSLSQIELKTPEEYRDSHVEISQRLNVNFIPCFLQVEFAVYQIRVQGSTAQTVRTRSWCHKENSVPHEWPELRGAHQIRKFSHKEPLLFSFQNSWFSLLIFFSLIHVALLTNLQTKIFSYPDWHQSVSLFGGFRCGQGIQAWTEILAAERQLDDNCLRQISRCFQVSCFVLWVIHSHITCWSEKNRCCPFFGKTAQFVCWRRNFCSNSK